MIVIQISRSHDRQLMGMPTEEVFYIVLYYECYNGSGIEEWV